MISKKAELTMNEFLIDVHAHLFDMRLKNNLNILLENARHRNIKKIICVGYDFETSKTALKLAMENESIFATFGIHPNNLISYGKDYIDFIKKNYNHKKVVGIGEIGLDYHHEKFDKENQKKVFIEQLNFANIFKLPVQVHCRDAMKDVLEILNSHKELLKSGGILHCFQGSFEELKEVEALGLKISVGGIVTFKNALEMQNLIKNVPIDMIVFETDCPYLTPHPYRGQINEPKFLELTMQKTAELKNLSYSEMIKISTKNCHDVFKKLF